MNWVVFGVCASGGPLALAWVITDAERMGWRKGVDYLTDGIAASAPVRMAIAVVWVAVGVALWPLLFAIFMGWVKTPKDSA